MVVIKYYLLEGAVHQFSLLLLVTDARQSSLVPYDRDFCPEREPPEYRYRLFSLVKNRTVILRNVRTQQYFHSSCDWGARSDMNGLIHQVDSTQVHFFSIEFDGEIGKRQPGNPQGKCFQF
jgi:hypothetical protein